MTRLPVPRDLAFSDSAMLRASRYYPLVGLLVGGIGALVLWLASLVLPMMVAVLISTGATLLVTGAFHEDGLADCADGLGGGLTRDRCLDIMRDSRIGTYGAVSLGLVLALKVATLAQLPMSLAAVLLITGHGLSRMAAVYVITRHAYARETGAKFVAPSVSPASLRIALITSALLAVLLLATTGPGLALTALGTGALAAAILTRAYLRKLDGYTGDCLGATQQLAECGFYLGALAWAA
ncbi:MULTISPECIES: adenosylcobinamide-GDP ribazoletransferase [unclassified Marinovum]